MMIGELLSTINWKTAFFLGIVMLFVFSDVFQDLFLTHISDTLEAGLPTTKGTIIQIGTTIGSYILLDLLVKGGVI